MIRVINDTCILIKENGLSFIEINAIMLGLIDEILSWVPNEGDVLHYYKVCTYVKKSQDIEFKSELFYNNGKKYI